MKIVCSLMFLLSLSFAGLSFSIDRAGVHNQLYRERSNEFTPGGLWYDTGGNLINAHGGGVLFSNQRYYWFGEKRGTHASQGVSVYSSTDLYSWKNEGTALLPEKDSLSDIAEGCVMERPKVVYNRKTHRYVMWFHLELKGQGYKAARVGVAESQRVAGPYHFVKSFRPNGHDSRDMTVYVDDDGSAYELYASRSNYDLRLAILSDDYLSVTSRDTILFSKHREAPALFKYKGRYFLYTSACTGWAPNGASLHVASSIWGPWSQTSENPLLGAGADTTFGGQSAFILPLNGKKDAFIFIADRWNPHDLQDSRYLWLPILFKNDLPWVEWQNQWKLDVFKN
jgi:beta-galactosidase